MASTKAGAPRTSARSGPAGGSSVTAVLAARWLGLPAGDARYFVLPTAAPSILGYEHTRDEPAIRLWNDNRHAVQEHLVQLGLNKARV
jgi:hypothetical protein